MTTWGSWTSDGRLEAGLALSMSPSTVGTGTSSVTISWTLYGKSKYASNESGSTATPYSLSGDISASGYGQGWSVGAGGTWVVASGSKTFSTSYTSENTVNVTAGFTSSYAYPGDHPTVTSKITIPTRPYSLPAAITNLAWARVSDTQQTVTWTNNSTSSAPYQKIWLDRQVDDGSWATIATFTTLVTSYSDKGTSATHKYRYRIRAENSSGFCATYDYSSVFYTTPPAPTNCAAAKTSTGDIVVSWGDPTTYNDTFTIYRSDAGGAFAAIHTQNDVAGANPETYTDPAPSATQTHAYYVTAHVATPSLNSPPSNTSNTVQLLAAPNAPSKLKAALTSGGAAVTVADTANPIYLSWQHNPVDTTAQTKYEVQYQVDGGAWTSMGQTTSTTSKATVAANGWGANGHTIGWQVRTWGSYTSPSPWSSTSTVTLSTTPTVVVNTPDGTDAIATSTLTVVWGYAQAEGSPQASWKVKLYDASMNLIETQSGNGTDSSHPMNTILTNGASYTVGAIVTSAAGLTSSEFQQPMPVSFALPPEPTVVATWNAEMGAVQLDVNTAAPVSPQIAADHIQVWRQAVGSEWNLVADNVPLGSTVFDYIPVLRTMNTYLAVAVTTLPSVTVGTGTPVDTTPGCHQVWVNAGGNFSSTACFTTGIDITLDDGVDKALNKYAGRTKPVETTGEQTTYQVQLKATIYDPLIASSLAAETSSVNEISAVALNAAPACIRTPDGMRRFVSLGTPSFGALGPSKVRSVAWTLTEIDYAEPTGLNFATGPVGLDGNWTLAFNDEFTGNAIDTTKWQPNWYGEGDTMNNVGTYAANVSVSGGQCTLTLASSASGALIHTDIPGGYRLPVGSYVEASIMFPGDGTNLYNWPAWWATSSDADGWPNAGENDIAEVTSSGSGTLGVHYHWPPSNQIDAYTQAAYMGDSFHVYGLYRLATQCEVYWDGVKVATYNTSDNGNPEILVFNVGAKSDGNGTMTGAAGAMVIDWVRAWIPA